MGVNASSLDFCRKTLARPDVTSKEPWNESDSVMDEFYRGFAEVLQRLIDQEVAC
ncbi:hypothetical protein [Streptomyces sp. NPDC059092]|uniref:hypothetical protein n=1 Tax=Streptomyces sp. NPDC059092 TaxID=3346725 RepID=UPI0036C5429F